MSALYQTVSYKERERARKSLEGWRRQEKVRKKARVGGWGLGSGIPLAGGGMTVYGKNPIMSPGRQ
jgi:hypothetical protein